MMRKEYLYWCDSALYWLKRKTILWDEYLITRSNTTLEYVVLCEKQWQWCLTQADEVL